ncbi:hypothetical protein MMC25_005653 [Agyrium rufum]|nr:hypothetical protein [Agyrium rufum]
MVDHQQDSVSTPETNLGDVEPSTRAPSYEKQDIQDPEKGSLSSDSNHDLEKQDAEPISADAKASDDASSEEESEYPTGLRMAAIVVALIVSIFLVALDMTIVATAIPEITDQFHSLDQVGWYGSAFFLTLASFQSTWGKAYKYFPLKATFLLTIFIFEIGSLICGVANDSTTLIVGRAVAGMGGAGVASGAYSIIAFSAPPSRRPAFTGLLGASYGIASTIGPLLGGVFTSNATWRWCFYVNLPIGGLAAGIILLTFRTPKNVKPVEAPWKEKLLQMDFPGTFVIMAAVVCYLLALQWGGVTKPWSDSTVIGCLVGFALLIITFIAVEYFSGDRALLQGRLLKKREIYLSSIYIVFLAGSFFMLLYYIPIYFQSVDGVSPSQSGVRNLPFVIGASICTVLSGGLITVTGHYVPFMMLASTLTAIGCGLIYTFDIGTPASHWIGYQALAGMGTGFGIQIPIIVAQASVEPIDISATSAMILFFQTIGGSLLVSCGQSAFTNRLVTTVTQNVPGIESSLVISTGATAIRETFSAEQIPGVLMSYVSGLKLVFAIAIATAGVSAVVAPLMPWRKINAMDLMSGGA